MRAAIFGLAAIALSGCVDPSTWWDQADDEPTLVRIRPAASDAHFRWSDGGPHTVAIDTPSYDQADSSLRLYTPEHAVAGCGPTAVMAALAAIGSLGDVAWQLDPSDGLDRHELAAAELVAELGREMDASYSATSTTTKPQRTIYETCAAHGAQARRLWSLDEIEGSIAAGLPVVVVIAGPTWGDHCAVVRRADSRVFDGDQPRRWFTLATGNSERQVPWFAADDQAADRITYAWAIWPLGGDG